VAERQQIVHWLCADRSRVVVILGLGWMGKTSLAAQCVREIASNDSCGQFDDVIWRPLVNAPPLNDLLPSLLQRLAGQQLTEIPASLDEQLRLLLGYLRARRVPLVLDNVESILTAELAGVYASGYDGYGQLIQQMATLEHQSHLLLTSCERPHGYARLERDSNQVRSL
jgi:hypothetical protein